MCLSVTIGMTGATITPTGTPAPCNAAIVRMRACGAAARGSSCDESLLSSVVTDTIAETRPCSAIGASRSRSRAISADLVIRLTGCRASASTSRHCRVMRCSRSIGW